MKKMLLPLLILMGACSWFHPGKFIYNEGGIQGTSYHITYQSPGDIDFHDSIKRILHEFDLSLSAYNPQSILSRINRNDSAVLPDKYFLDVFHKSEEVYKTSDGAFDITVGPLVSAWGFGPERKLTMDKEVIDSLLQFTGMFRVKLVNNQVVKSDPRIRLDVNALAQGYSCDVLAAFLKRMGISNYMIEIGGEVRVHGRSPEKQPWRVAIDRPREGTQPGEDIQIVAALTDCSMSTSGNYHKFKVENGVKYTHTINPKTGYTVRSRLLSATIVADDCITADAYATVCMVSGLEKSMEIIQKMDLEAYLIYSDDQGNFKTYSTRGMDRMTDPGSESIPQ